MASEREQENMYTFEFEVLRELEQTHKRDIDPERILVKDLIAEGYSNGDAPEETAETIATITKLL